MHNFSIIKFLRSKMSDKILDGLNKEQKEAVLTTDGPMLILAGAGSGKTKVITHKIAYLIGERKANPEEILAVTFTNKAANEMKERIEKILLDSLGRKVYIPYMGTFHSICVRILKSEGEYIGINSNFSIYDTNDQIDLIKQAMNKLNIDPKSFNPRKVQGYISNAKNEYISPEEYKKLTDGYFQEVVSQIYSEYSDLLEKNNALDFDDLINKTVDLLDTVPSIRKKYQKRFKYILVDEYQDTNHTQYLLISLLTNRKLNNICVVGDEDQSIYKFRGATIKNILDFEKDFPKTKIIKLEQNYRSTKPILDAAYDVIRHNPNRRDKKLWTEKKEGEKITVYKATDEKDEANFIAETIIELDDNDNVGILYRTNAQSRSLEESLLKYNIPYKLIGGTKFYERKEIKDILAFLRIIYNEKDDRSLIRIINTPPRKIGPRSIELLQKKADRQEKSMVETLRSESSNLSGGLSEFSRILDDLIKAKEEMNVYDLLAFIMKRTGYIKSLNDESEINLARIENLKELLSVAYDYRDFSPNESLEKFLEDVALVETEQELQESNNKDNQKVTLMTIHAAKGLEFDHVFIAGMEESLFPHSRSYSDPKDMEEERRLAYVAITRARHKLYVTHAERRMIWGSTIENPISRFVADISDQLIERYNYFGQIDDNSNNEWSNVNEIDRSDSSESPKGSLEMNFEEGDKVMHQIFGEGIILSVENGMVKVSFGPKIGVKTLALEFAGLSRV